MEILKTFNHLFSGGADYQVSTKSPTLVPGILIATDWPRTEHGAHTYQVPTRYVSTMG